MFLKRILPSLNLDMSIIANRESAKNKNKMADSVNQEEMVHYKPTHLDLHCLQKYLLVCRAERVNNERVTLKQEAQ